VLLREWVERPVCGGPLERMTPVATLLQMRASARITLRCVLVEVADDPADDVVVGTGSRISAGG
jgi:hypothetical protein